VYFLIPLILVMCGGDLGWWQAWLYSLLIVAAGIGGRMWAEQRHPGLMAERQNIENIQNAKAWDKVLAPLMAVSVGYPMVFVAGLDHRYHWSSEFPLWPLSLHGHWQRTAFSPAWCAFRRIEGTWYVTVALTDLCGTRDMPEIFLHCSVLSLP
jgi:hypothetical protein